MSEAGVTELMNAPAPAPAADPGSSAAPAWRPSGFPTTPVKYNHAVAVEARAKIDELKSDKEFFKRLQQQDPAAHQEWNRLHKEGWPSPTQVTSQAEVDVQAAARNEERWSGYIQALRAQWPVSAEHEAEIRGGG